MDSERELAQAGEDSAEPDFDAQPARPDELEALQVRPPPSLARVRTLHLTCGGRRARRGSQREHRHVLRELALAVEAGAIAPRGKALAQWAARVVSPERDENRVVLARELGVDQAVARLRIKRWASVAARARSDLETVHRSLDELLASARAALEGMVHEIKLMVRPLRRRVAPARA